MANKEHVDLLKKSVKNWNSWRKQNPEIQPNLENADLRSCNLSGANLTGALLRGVNCQGANLSSASLKIIVECLKGQNERLWGTSSVEREVLTDASYADFRGADLTKVNLKGVKLHHADLRESNLSGANLNSYFYWVGCQEDDETETIFVSTDFTSANLSGVDLTVTSCSNRVYGDRCNDEPSFYGTDFPIFAGADLCEAKLNGIDFRRLDFRKSNLSRADLRKAIFKQTNLSGATLREADLREAIFENANLCETDLSQANLSKLEISETNLQLARLEGTNLEEVTFKGSDLTGANFESANLAKAKFEETSIKDVNLCRAYLTSVDFRNQVLISANFYGSVLKDTDLSDLSLSGKDLSYADLSGSNLSRVQALGTNFSNATLTGACIADWHIGNFTDLSNVECDYIFRKIDKDSRFIARLPVGRERLFAPQEFAQRFQILASAQETIDLTFPDGIDWQAFFQSFQKLCCDHPGEGLSILGMERKRGAFIIRLDSSDDSDRSAIETAIKRLYAVNLARLEVQYEERLKLLGTRAEEAQEAIKIEKQEKAQLIGIIEVMAENQGPKYEFNGSVASVVNTAESGSRIQAILHNYAPEKRENLASAAKEIQELLEQLSENYPLAEVPSQAITQIQRTPRIRERVMGAIKGGGKAAIEELVDHPAISIVLAAIEGAS